ncbi:hypothetical protein, partial [Micromonospora sp. NPDC002717]|uniref:hypothetical protein n=1 Tax=Micromonospora sp. NPDC002717 TaxID=3154424 RepID=UPI00331BAE08
SRHGRRATTDGVWPAVPGAGIKPDRPEPGTAGHTPTTTHRNPHPHHDRTPPHARHTENTKR